MAVKFYVDDLRIWLINENVSKRVVGALRNYGLNGFSKFFGQIIAELRNRTLEKCNYNNNRLLARNAKRL